MTVIPFPGRPAQLEQQATGKRTYTKLTASAQAALDQDVRRYLGAGSPGNADWRRLAHKYNVSLRKVQYDVERLRDSDGLTATVTVNGRRLRYPLPADTDVLIAEHKQIRSAYQQLFDEGRYLGSYHAFRNSVYREFGWSTTRGAAKGLDEMQHMRSQQQRPPFMQRYTIDLFSLRTRLGDVDCPRPPMAILVREENTQTNVFDWVFDSDQVNADDLISIFAEAFRGTTLPDGTFLGGVADSIWSDNATINTATPLLKMVRRFGCNVWTFNAHRPHEDGAHEREHGTGRSQELSRWPGSSDGHTDAKGALLPDPRRLMTLAEARAAVHAWADKRNNARGADGRTPLERWRTAAAELPPRRPRASEVAQYAHRHEVSCQKYPIGLLFNTKHYVHGALADHPERRYLVGTWLRDLRTVEVFTIDGSYVTTAARSDQLTAAEQQDLKAYEARNTAAARSAINAAKNGAAARQRADDAAAAAAAAAEAVTAINGMHADPADAPAPGDTGASRDDHLTLTGLLTSLAAEPMNGDES